MKTEKPILNLVSEKLYLCCEKKHLFSLTALEIKDQKWCPECIGNKKDDDEFNFMEELERI